MNIGSTPRRMLRLMSRAIVLGSIAYTGAAQAGDSQSLVRTINTASISGLDSAQVQGMADLNNTQSWRGIKFAQAERWRAPVDPAPWSGVRDATAFGDICSQLGSFFGDPEPQTFGQPIGSEDCHFLNVWRPKNSDTNLPVLFWIHGGSNLKGAGSENLYNGANFAKKANAIVVSVNYRVGSLGWFTNPAIEDGDAKDNSGNYVTLDLIKSLEWVRDNIAQFGGNPNSVTIAGQSAGCINAWGLLQSPLADSLVDRMLCMSGLPNAYPKVAGYIQSNDIVDNLLIENGYADNKVDAIAFRLSQGNAWVADFMRNLPAEALVRHTPSPILLGHFNDGHVLPYLGYADLILGGYHKVPMILGSTKDEGSYFAGELASFYEPSHAELWDMINYQEPENLVVTDVVKSDLYPLYKPVHKVLSLAINLTTDNISRYLRLLQGNIYRYNFDWDSTPEPWKEVFGSIHGMDLPFLFGNFLDEDKPDLTRFMISDSNAGQRADLSDDFIQYISQFMRNGNPNRSFDGLTNWADWSNFWIYQKRLVLDNNIKSSSHDFWLSDVNAALNGLSAEDRDTAEELMSNFQLQLEDGPG